MPEEIAFEIGEIKRIAVEANLPPGIEFPHQQLEEHMYRELGIQIANLIQGGGQYLMNIKPIEERDITMRILDIDFRICLLRGTIEKTGDVLAVFQDERDAR